MDLMKLPNTELEVMQVIWDKELEGPVSSKTVTDFFLEERNWKRTTTLTILGRLEEKSFLNTDRELRRNRYTSLVSKKDYLAFITKYYLENVYGNSVKKLFAGLLDSKEVTKEEMLKTLKEMQNIILYFLKKECSNILFKKTFKFIVEVNYN